MAMIVAGIPAFNEEGTIAKVVVHASRHVDRVVVVDDGSTDDTTLIAESLGAVVVRHQRRMGYGAAIASCFRTAKELNADILCTLDADGQHDPDQIPDLVKPIMDGLADVVVGSRFLRSNDESSMPEYRKAGVRFITKFTDVASSTGFSDAQCGFRAYGRQAIEKIRPVEQGMGVSTEVLMKAVEEKFRIVEVPITISYRALRTSTHNPLYHSADVIAGTIKFISIRHPLIFYGGLALIALALSMAFGLWTIQIFANEGRLVTNLVLISLGSGFIGVSSLFTAIILFVLINVIRERK